MKATDMRPHDVQIVIDDRHFSQDVHRAHRRRRSYRDNRAVYFVLSDDMSLGRYQWD